MGSRWVYEYTFFDEANNILDILHDPSPDDCTPTSSMDYCGGCPMCLLMQTDTKKWEADGQLVVRKVLAKRGRYA